MTETQALGPSSRDAAEQTVELCFDNFRAFLKSSSANLSPDGIFVETEEPAEPGTAVSLELSLNDGHPLIRGRGTVAWARSGGTGDETPGMGIRFLDLDAESERLIGRIVEERTKAGLAVFALTREPSANPAPKPREARGPERPMSTIPLPMIPLPMTPIATTDDIQAEIEALRCEHEEERSRYQAEIDAAREAAADLNTRLRDSLSRMMATVDARDALSEELRSVQETARQDRERVEELAAERTRLQQELEESGAEINRWTEEAVAATTERGALAEQLATAHEKIEDLASEIGDLRGSAAEEIAHANAELTKATSAKEEIEGKLQVTETALETLENETAEIESSLRQSLADAQSEIEEKQRKNEDVAGEAKALEEEVDRVRTELAEAWGRAEKLEGEAEQTRDAMAQLQSRHDEMEAQAAIDRKAAARAEKLVERVRAEHATLQNDLAEAQAAFEEIRDSQRSLEAEKAEDAELSATAKKDERSDDDDPAPRSTVRTRVADLAARLRGGKAENTYSDLFSLDEPVAESEPDEHSGE